MKNADEHLKGRILQWALPPLILALLSLVIYFHDFGRNVQFDQHEKGIDLFEIRENNPAINSYVDFVSHGPLRMNPNHDYSSKALLKLMEAITAVSDFTGVALDGRMASVLIYASRITDNPYETTHADDIRAAADMLSEALLKIQMAKYPGLSLEVNAVTEAARQINPEVLTLDQKEAVCSFFGEAATLLDKMN